MSATRKPGCIPCRERHMRCDRSLPVCSSCAKTNRDLECLYVGIKVRQSRYSAKVQPLSSRRRRKDNFTERRSDVSVPIIDPCVVREDCGPPHHSNTRPERNIPSKSPTDCTRRPSDSLHQNTLIPANVEFSSPDCSYREISSPSAIIYGQQRDLRSSQSTSKDPCNTEILSPSAISCLHNIPIRRSVTGSKEAVVFEFYIANAGPWLDIVSSARHFGQSVPRLALREPVLYYACLAYASHVMTLQGQLTPEDEAEYHDKAFGLLIPLLTLRPVPSQDAALLATSVILRMSEQFAELAEDAQHHLNGAFSLFGNANTKWSPSRLDVGGTAFWIYLRESLRLCFLNEQTCQFNLDLIEYDLDPLNNLDEAWANRMTYLLARTCNICWSKSGSRSILQARIDQLQDLVEVWQDIVPETYRPWYDHQKPTDVFSTIRYLSTWHVIGWQQFFAARVMLAVYSPNRPTDGSMSEVNQYLHSKILAPARALCGVCMSSPDVGSNINGTHLVAWCGQFFTGREEQRLLVNHLVEFMDKTKWPNKTCFERLQHIWSGQRKSWVEA